MATNRALTFGFGGYADLDLTFGEFFNANHTVSIRFMPQHPYASAGPMLAENGSGTYLIGQGDYRWGSGDAKLLGPATLFVQVGGVKVTYEVPGFVNKVGGPVGYRGVWQHLAVVRDGQTIKTFLNGQLLSGFEGAELVIPTTGLPAAGTPLRLGRRTNGTSASKKFWQYYGLIDSVAIFTQALTTNAIQQLVAAGALTGNESGLYAGWNFDGGRQPATLSRPVTIPTAWAIPGHFNSYAAQAVPVYYVDISANYDSIQDRNKMDVRPSKVKATLPFAAGEWWHVDQGREHPAGSHNGTAAFASDFVRVNGPTIGATIFAAAPGRVFYAEDQQADDAGNAISAYHGDNERVVYMHIAKGSYAGNFPGASAHPQNVADAAQPKYLSGDPVVRVGDPLTMGAHLHLAFGTMSPQTWVGATDSPTIPAAISNYYRSTNSGKTWTNVALGVPAYGELVARYPYSPWGDKGDIMDVAPAVSSRQVDRLDVFVRGENSHLWLKRWNGTEWTAWQQLDGGRLTSSPAAVSWGPDRIDVVARGFDLQLAHKRWSSDQGWSEWRNLGGQLTSAPAIASWGPNRLDVFARGQNEHLWHIRWNGTEWSEWRDLGGRLTSAPAAVSWGLNRIDVFVRGFEGGLAHKRWTNDLDWSEWRDLGGRLTSAPTVASWGPNRLDVFVRGYESQLAQKRWDGTEWSEWRNLGGRLTSGPGAVSWGTNRIDVLVRGFEHQLAQKRWTPDKEWSEWRNLDQD